MFNPLIIEAQYGCLYADQQSESWTLSAGSGAVTQHLLTVLRTASSVICFPVHIMGSVECIQVAQEKKTNLQNNSLIGLTVMH